MAIVGAGGKSTLMFALAEEVRKRGFRVITSTTTKVWESQAERSRCVVLTEADGQWKMKLRRGLSEHGEGFVGSRRLQSGKIEGISPETADQIYQERIAGYLLVEADGASGLPVKAPADHEPVISSTTTLTIGMIGIDALGAPCSAEVVFRLERFLDITGAREKDPLTLELIDKLAQDEKGIFKNCPRNARKVLFLNRVDRLSSTEHLKGLDALGRGTVTVILGSLREYYFEVMR